MTRRVNVVVVSSRNMVFRMFDCQRSLDSPTHTGINEKKYITIPIVADSLHENPEVGTMVPKNAMSHVRVFFY